MEIRAYEITAERHLETLDPELMDDSWDADEVCRWIDVSDFKSGEIEELLDRLGIEVPSRVRDSICQAQERPRVISTERILSVSMPVFVRAGIPAYLTTVCASTTIITIQHSPEPLLEEIAELCREDRRLPDANPVAVLCHVIDAGLKRTIPLILELRAEIFSFSENLSSEEETVTAQEFLELKDRINAIEVNFEDQIYCLLEIAEYQSDTLKLDSVHRLIANLRQDVQMGFSTMERMKDRIRDLYQHHLQAAEETTNQRLKTLTVLSAIYLPATLIAGIYGMNFEDIPVVGIEHGYLIVMLIMTVVVVGQLSFFYRRGWFK